MHNINNLFRWLIIALLLAACSENEQQKPPALKEQSKSITAKAQIDLSKLPQACRKLVPLLMDSENPSRYMAHIEQESSCNPYALSPAGAIGLAQIMPETLEWGSRTFARHLGKPRPNDVLYSVAFIQTYMDYFTVDLFQDYCSNKEVDEKRYNGGYYIIWEIKFSDGTLEGAEAICGTRLSNGRKRSKQSCYENYEYSRHIARRQEKYASIGGTICK